MLSWRVMDSETSRAHARSLDRRDPLAGYRSQFVISDPQLLYLDGNSLGRLPVRAARRLERAINDEWATGLVGGWNTGWYDAPARIGERIGKLVGAGGGQIIAGDSTSVNLFKLAVSALGLRPNRSRIVTDELNFPSDLYVLQGINRLLGDRHEIVRIGSRDGGVTPDIDALYDALDGTTALLTLSHVVFKSGYLYDMAETTRRAHEAGALVLWDLSHSVGSVDIQLDSCEVDFAIGCTYKYLNGGPGSPAFLYVNERLQKDALSPIWGWFGRDSPFSFDVDYEPASGVARFLAGTPPVLSMLAVESSLEPLLEAGIDAIRRKSVGMTEYFISLSDAILQPLGFVIGSPRDAARRGGHVSLRHAEGYRINRALIEEMKVIPDFREPDNIRFGFSPLYTRYDEIWQAVDRLRTVVVERRFEHYSQARLSVT